MKLSDHVKLIISQIVKKAITSEMKWEQRLIFEAEFDKEGCEQVLEDLTIRKDNVLSYLQHKYVETVIENGMAFPNQKCLQRAVVDNEQRVLITIKNSEPHKILTDTIHVFNRLEANNIPHSNNVKIVILNLKVVYFDVALYFLCLKQWNLPLPSQHEKITKDIFSKYPTLEAVAQLRRKNIKRKLLRYYLKQGWIEWKDLRALINLREFDRIKVYDICTQIKQNAFNRGVKAYR